MSYGVGSRHGLDPALLWLWCRLEATTPFRPLDWEPAYAVGVALEKAKRQKQTNKKNKHLLQDGELEVGWSHPRIRKGKREIIFPPLCNQKNLEM